MRRLCWVKKWSRLLGLDGSQQWSSHEKEVGSPVQGVIWVPSFQDHSRVTRRGWEEPSAIEIEIRVFGVPASLILKIHAHSLGILYKDASHSGSVHALPLR